MEEKAVIVGAQGGPKISAHGPKASSQGISTIKN